MNVKRFITVITQFEGFHAWPQAPDEVEFLRYKHRHLFGVSVTLEVMHNDRELEFFLVKKKVDELIDLLVDKEDVGSCEMCASQLATALHQVYDRFVSVTVSEDKENSATVIIKKEENKCYLPYLT